MAKLENGTAMDIADLAVRVGFKDGTCLCGECNESEFPLSEAGAVRATLNSDKPDFNLLCVSCAQGAPFADVTVSVTDGVDEDEFAFLLADMCPGEINMWVRVVPDQPSRTQKKEREARKKRSLGEFRAGRYVEYFSYGGFGSIQRYYGQVTRVDVERSKVIWLPMGQVETVETEYPPPKPEEPSSWKFEVILKSDVPKSRR